MNYALIVAGGSGSRMNSAIPKQFLELDGKPLLYHTIQRFLDYATDLHIVVVLPSGQSDASEQLMDYFGKNAHIQVVEGGQTRFHSVQNGLKAIAGKGIVFIHDGVRPFVSHEVLERCYQHARIYGNAIPCIELKDSIRYVNGKENRAVLRGDYKAMQTPQTFDIDAIQSAFAQAYSPAFTDEASVFEKAGNQIVLVEGNEENIKITTRADLALAHYLIKK